MVIAQDGLQHIEVLDREQAPGLGEALPGSRERRRINYLVGCLVYDHDIAGESEASCGTSGGEPSSSVELQDHRAWANGGPPLCIIGKR